MKLAHTALAIKLGLLTEKQAVDIFFPEPRPTPHGVGRSKEHNRRKAKAARKARKAGR